MTFRLPCRPLLLLSLSFSFQGWAREESAHIPPQGELSWIAPDASRIVATARPPLDTQKMTSLRVRTAHGSPWRPLAFDATMPAHKHGMVVVPKAPLAEGDGYTIHGVKLHMNGAWILRLKVKNESKGQEIWLETPYLLKPLAQGG